MRTTIDSAGRVVIPKPLRTRLGLEGGDPVEIQERDGHLEIAVVPTEMHLDQRSGVSVAVPREELPVLTADLVRETLERSRR